MFSVILHSLCGFYIQILPCAFYCIYPFYDNFRHPRKRYLMLLASLLVLMSAIFTFFYVKLGLRNHPSESYLPLNIIFLLTIAFLLAIYMFCIRADTVHKMFVFILLVNYGFLLTESVSYVSSFLPPNPDYMYSTDALILHLIFNAVLFYPMLCLLRRARRAFASPIIPAVWKEITLIPMFFVLGLIVFYEIPVSSNLSDHHVLIIFVKAMEVLMIVLCFFMLHILETMRRQSDERSSLEAEVKNYRFMAEAADQVREAHHEIRHHIAALSILLHNKDYAGAEDYLKKVSQTQVPAAVSAYTPHILLNSMLSEYQKRAEDAEISVSYTIQVPSAVSIDDLDLCQFFSNLMDNALEANGLLPPDRRQLSLTIRQTDNFLFFQCKNPYDPKQLHFTDNRPDTGKADKSVHGYGISIMEQIAEKYNGVFHIETKDGQFTVSANLCIPADLRKEM